MLMLINHMNKLSVLFIAVISLFLFTQTASAKVLPQAAKATSKTIAKTTSTGINITPRLKSDRRALIVYFSALQNATSVSYMLTYGTSTQQEGAGGSLNLTNGSSQTSELLFGTCSKGVCTYHRGIKNAKLDVTYALKSGKKYIKRYRIKV